MTLPPATPKPCNDCPWRRNAVPGWLGPYDAQEWVQMAHGEEPIACHQTIKDVDDYGTGDWNHPAMKQCAGAAIYRANVCKSPRNPAVARADAPDRETVFATPYQFIEYHGEDE